MNLWVLVLATAGGCYALKVAGYLVPARLLDAPQVRRLVELLPVALLAALVVVEAVASGTCSGTPHGSPASAPQRWRYGAAHRSSRLS